MEDTEEDFSFWRAKTSAFAGCPIGALPLQKYPHYKIMRMIASGSQILIVSSDFEFAPCVNAIVRVPSSEFAQGTGSEFAQGGGSGNENTWRATILNSYTCM